MICADQISFSYDDEATILDQISFSIKNGEFIAILGNNGSGKSTLTRHLNGLLELQNGTLTVDHIDVSNRKQLWELRKKVGMVFQNPDNQFVSSIVSEDIAFGLENYHTKPEDIPQLVNNALEMVHMSGFEKKSTHMLSGGQKQRIALAGVLALDPDILVFDESTAMLDPQGRKEVLEIISHIHQTSNKTIIMITHYIEEAVHADKVCLMKKGRIVAYDNARKILSDTALLKEAQLEPPVTVKLFYDLLEKGISLPYCPLTSEEFVEVLCPSV